MDAAGYVTPEEVRLALRKLHSEDTETNPEMALRSRAGRRSEARRCTGTLEAKLAGDSGWRHCLSHCWAYSFTSRWGGAYESLL